MIKSVFLEIETTSNEEYQQTERAEIKAFRIFDGEILVCGRTIYELFDYFKSLTESAVNVWVYDLEFVSMFFLYVFEENGYTQVDKLKDVGEYEFFQTFTGAVYSLSFVMGNTKVYFRDFANLVPVKRVLNVEEMHKAYNDVCKNSKYLSHSSTCGAGAYKTWLMQYYNQYSSNDYYFNAKYKKCQTQIRQKLPHIKHDTDEYSIISMSFAGGIDYIKKGWLGADDFRGVAYDCNGLYSYVMSTYNMPIGYPYFVEKVDLTKLQIVHIYIYKGKCVGTAPFIQKRFYKQIRCSEKLEQGFYAMWNFEFELFKNYYRPDFEILNVLEFKQEKGLFNKFIRTVYPLKKSDNEYVQASAKQMLNTLSGKFATKEITGRRYCTGIGADGLLNFKAKLERKEKNEHYRAISSYIYARARCIMVELIAQNFHSCVYSATDSLFLVGKPDKIPIGVKVDDKEMGAFKKVASFKNMRIFRSRAYIFEDYNGNLGTCISGLAIPCQKKLTFDNAKPNTVLKGGNIVTALAIGGAIKTPQDYRL
jgi:hypothetical protein